ncbi:putative endo-1,3(4)-beta-glucanase-like protein 1 [Colletotrichum chlorophyti]|uniref:glucan endo-1,3-beta-D-glucosidase n=1 Tax=Colletotrichum chlorophyti TaxID=708187 RepID=A0A1Q8S4Z6_9PEZI|nr:putative endo-1,3(4)-beta-glucanase-like protein 1 [Colletotrichum chlorophyti]
MGGSEDIFVPIFHDRPILVPSRDDHPQKPVGVDQDGPIQTNKFYANFFINNQDNATWTHPYSVWWPNGKANQGHGLCVSHTDRESFIYGPGNPVQSFEDTAFQQSIALSAYELQNGTVLTTDSLTAFSVNVNLATKKGADPLVSFPLVQGMAFVTGVYRHATIILQSEKNFSSITELSPDTRTPGTRTPGAKVYGYSVILGDSSNWLIYLTPTQSSERPTLRIMNTKTLVGPGKFTGTVQVAKNPKGKAGIDVFNKAAGAYPVRGTVSGSVSGRIGKYTISWTKGGVQESPLLMFALPHHVKTFDERTRSGVTGVKLASTTKGIATATFAEAFTMIESDLPTEIGFDPWSPRSVGCEIGRISSEAKAAIVAAAKLELTRNIVGATNQTSKYYSGIDFSKYARALYAINNIAGDTSFTAEAVKNLEIAFERYVNNEEPNPLVYDNVWKGLVSDGSYDNHDTSVDFGNTYYNDHNFHYGYYVYTAAVIAYFDPLWLTKNGGVNKIWVNNLIRDWSNPSMEDPYFPFSRSFDWFHGHSWARGVIEAPDGKDQESTAEDSFSTYAIKMWGYASGDADTEARGNLQLAVNARSIQSYYLMTSDNDVQPPNFIGNRAAGIIFERKANHTTWFGDELVFIEGIHVLPVVPSSAYVRKPSFVREEWDQYFAGNKSGVLSGATFAGHLLANLAIADNAGAVESYEFMRTQQVDSPMINGASLAWNLAYSACLGGSLASNSTSSNSTWGHR